MSQYNPQEIERKWQKIWAEKKIHEADLFDKNKEKYYCLVMFPYPSAAKLHIGHFYNFGPADTYARFKRLQGFNVFEPMGFDSFGLPAENYAVATGVHPKKSTEENIKSMRRQLQIIGAMYDWTKEIITSRPEYYKWTQWLFLKLHEMGLAYRRLAPANWCPSCKTVLANEQVKEGLCERCDSEVTKKELTQWFFKIRDYAERLLNFDSLDWPEKTKLMQEYWISRSSGSEIIFQIDGKKEKIPVFTTRTDTLFGCTYLILAPEHSLVMQVTTKEHEKNVLQYIEAAKKKRDIDRTAETIDKTGVFTGGYALNSVNGEKIPIWIADYVIMAYGTGAVMAVPAHDIRDAAFAKKYKLPMKTVILPSRTPGTALSPQETHSDMKDAFVEDGILINSEKFSNLTSEEARYEITKFLEKKKLGKLVVEYKLRDWLISRQRYWGCPIPIIYCAMCGEVPVPESHLPVLLPDGVDFKPAGDSKSPLAANKDFVNTLCPKCGGKAVRETDTIDTFICSSWYFLRYVDPKNSRKPFDKEIVKKWLPVDMYIGGAEHACMHLLYARFITKVLYDAKLINFDEPFTRLVHQGVITKNGAKMSKSRGNVVSPDPFIQKYGSDVFRMYLMFMGPYTEGGDFSDRGITGILRFANRIFALITGASQKQDSNEFLKILHNTIKKVTEDTEVFHFNTSLAALMEFVNAAYKYGISKESKKIFLMLLAPFAPHLAEELWEKLGEKFSIFDAKWPKYNKKYLEISKAVYAVCVNGKLRATIECDPKAEKDEVAALAKSHEKIKKYLTGKKTEKTIFIPQKLVNFVVKD